MAAYTLVFNGKNYFAWKTRMQMEIRFKLECPLALLDIPKDETPEQKQARNLQEGKAMGALFARLGDDVILPVHNANTVREVFRILDTQYAQISLATEYLQFQINLMQLNPRGDVFKHFTTMDALIAALIDCGRTVTDRDRGMMYLKSLPLSLQDIRQVCSTRLDSMKGYTSIHVKRAIMCACTKIQMCQQQRRENYSDGNPNVQNRDHCHRNRN